MSKVIVIPKLHCDIVFIILYVRIWLRLLNGLLYNKMVDGYFANNRGYIKYITNNKN